MDYPHEIALDGHETLFVMFNYGTSDKWQDGSFLPCVDEVERAYRKFVSILTL